MGKLVSISIEFDPFALLAIAAGGGIFWLAYYMFSRWRMEDGLRARRSPNKVRLEAAAVGLTLGAALPCLTGAWGFGWFLIFLAVAIVLWFWSGRPIVGFAYMGLGVILAIGALVFNLTPGGPKDPGAALKATPPEKAAPVQSPAPVGNSLQP